MTEISSNSHADIRFLLDQTANTRLNASEVAELAAKTKHIDVKAWEKAVVFFMDEAEDRLLGILLSACAANDLVLDPELLAETLKIVEPIIVYHPLFKNQTVSAIEPLLRVSRSEELSDQRKVIAVFLAAELAVINDADPEPVLKSINYHNVCRYRSDLMMLFEAEMMLEEKAPAYNFDDFFCQKDVLEVLSKMKPESIIGAGQTVRRPVAKVGRNEPCPCGSGKKYKKCCIDKDQEQLRDASHYKGLTRTQVLKSPELAPDNDVFFEMRSYHIKRIDPAKLRSDQLILAFRRAMYFGLLQKAYDFLLECERRKDMRNFDRGHFGDLLYEALDFADVQIADEILSHVAEEYIYDPAVAFLGLDVLKNREIFDRLEAAVAEAFTEGTEMAESELFYRLAFGFSRIWPALTILFSRAVLIGSPHRVLDNEMLFEELRKARAQIGLDPFEDGLENYYDWYLEREHDMEDEELKSERLRELEKQIEKEKKRAERKKKELKNQELRLKQLTEQVNRKLEQKAKIDASPARQAAPKAAPSLEQESESSGEERQLVNRLKDRVVSLKEEIRNQQEMRRQLRKELNKEQKMAVKRNVETQTGDPEETAALETVPDFDHGLKKIIVPEYGAAFRRSLGSLPPAIGAKALKAASGFAARDKATLEKSRRLKVLPNHYRIRVGINYRLMLKFIPDRQLEILDLIPRAKLETWIRGIAGKA